MPIQKSMVRVTAIAAVLASISAPGAQAASLASKFNAAIERMLMNTKEGAVSEMTEQEKKELIVCVQGVFSKISDEKKEYIVAATSDSELRQRFDKVGLENKAALKQQVRDECA